MAGLVPAIHGRRRESGIHGAAADPHRNPVIMGGRDKPGHDEK
jgi:hypothetical protein